MNKKRKKQPQWGRRALIGLTIALVVVFAGVGTLWMLIGTKFDRQESVRIYIPRGATDSAVSDTLAGRLGDGFGGRVAWLWRLQGGNPSVAEGSYVVDPGARAIDVSRRLLHGRQTPVRLTFNNIRTFGQLAARLASRMEFTEEEFDAACDSVLPAMGFDRPGYVAAFLPDTYEFYWNAPASAVVSRLADFRSRFWTDERRAQAASLGLTPVEVATVASIVEEETAKADERPMVARLYLNRIARRMPLQADPTVKFAVGDFSLRRITGKHLRVESPYNTYLNPGLPPGPIRIPERATLEAVLAAPAHGYIYMCAKEDFSGRHNFATDYATHLANARRYQAALDRRNIH